jgi:general stress protein 26
MSDEAAEQIRAILTNTLQSHHEGVLCTVDESGRPHATWMAFLCTHDFRHLITVTSADSDKAGNVRRNPLVEWMVTSADRSKVIYFEGEAEAVEDGALKDQYMQMVPEDSRRFFMKYYRAGGDWVVIKTRLDSIVYCMPGAYAKVRLSIDQVRGSGKA